jgi:hypothetical protein
MHHQHESQKRSIPYHKRMAQILVRAEVHMVNVVLRIDDSTGEERHRAIEFFIVEGQEAMPRSTFDFWIAEIRTGEKDFCHDSSMAPFASSSTFQCCDDLIRSRLERDVHAMARDRAYSFGIASFTRVLMDFTSVTCALMHPVLSPRSFIALFIPYWTKTGQSFASATNIGHGRFVCLIWRWPASHHSNLCTESGKRWLSTSSL